MTYSFSKGKTRGQKVAKTPKCSFQISYGAKCEFHHHQTRGSLFILEIAYGGTFALQVCVAMTSDKGQMTGLSQSGTGCSVTKCEDSLAGLHQFPEAALFSPGDALNTEFHPGCS